MRRQATNLMTKKNTKNPSGNVIALNRKARHDYFIESTFEAGLSLEGWEVKSMREGRAQITEAYVNLHRGEAWLVGAHFSPLNTASTHITTIPTRSRKLLLHRVELDRLTGAVDRKGYALIPLNLHRGEAFLVGAHFSPLNTASTHIKTDPTRSRKLLLHRLELDRLTGAVERKGYALIPLNLHWHKGRAKLDIGLGKGKKHHDKRADKKDQDWQRQKARILKK
jgi:SsrA-binding protein